jgi:hypothetical protein
MLKILKHARLLRGKMVSKGLLKSCANPSQAQSALLLRLVKRNAGTAFGRGHDFSGIRTEADFRARVPVREYEDFRPYIKRVMAGERNILTAEEPFMMTLTSGTTTEPKYIPVTRALQRQTASLISAWLYRAELDHTGLLDHASVGIVSRAVEGHTPRGIPYGSVSGLIYKNIPWLVRRAYAVPYQVSELNDYDERYFVAARFALGDKVSFIATPNPGTLLRLAETAAEHGERLVRATRDGTLGIESKEQSSLCAELARMLRPDPARARELERVIDAQGRLRLAACWPELRLIGCWTGGSAGLKLNQLHQVYDDVPVRDLGYMASEGRITVPFADETSAGVPALNSNYYEFIPEEEVDAERPAVLSLHELERARRYSILLTTMGGLYRYKINDIVEVTGELAGAPLLAFVRKEGEMTSITGEKMHVNHLLAALAEVTTRFRLEVEQFRAAPDYLSSRYEIFLELSQPASDKLLQEELLPALDDALMSANIEYAQKRRSRRLGPPRLYLMKRGWAGREMLRHLNEGRRDTQYKWQVLCQERREEDLPEIERAVEAANHPSPERGAFAA